MLDSVVARMKKGDWKGAKCEAVALIDERPTFAPAYAHLGLCYYHESNFAEAAKWFEKATSLDPHYWEAGTKLVQCLDRLQKFEEAYALALHWQSQRPNDPTLGALVHGLSFHAEGRRDAWQQTVNIGYKNVEMTTR